MHTGKRFSALHGGKWKKFHPYDTRGRVNSTKCMEMEKVSIFFMLYPHFHCVYLEREEAKNSKMLSYKCQLPLPPDLHHFLLAVISIFHLRLKEPRHTHKWKGARFICMHIITINCTHVSGSC